MSNYYIESWSFYKSYYQHVDIDYEYYLNLCKGFKTLDIFAGFGRLTNYLASEGVDIESVELEPNFAKFIQLPKEKNHVCNILDFDSTNKFERIIAAFNSFCLFTEEKDIISFFKKLDSLLVQGGIVSLSYYHPDYWEMGIGETDYFDHMGQTAELVCECDLSKRNKKLAVWIDIYRYKSHDYRYEYPTRVYESFSCLMPFLKGTQLKVIDVVKNYNKPDLPYPGWFEFVLKKE